MSSGYQHLNAVLPSARSTAVQAVHEAGLPDGHCAELLACAACPSQAGHWAEQAVQLPLSRNESTWHCACHSIGSVRSQVGLYQHCGKDSLLLSMRGTYPLRLLALSGFGSSTSHVEEASRKLDHHLGKEIGPSPVSDLAPSPESAPCARR